MSRTVIASLIVVAAAIALPAQGLLLSASPAVVAPGEGVTISITGPGGGATFDGCFIDLITEGTATGPIVFQASGCGTPSFVLAPGMIVQTTWDLRDQYGTPVAPGIYWLWIGYLDGQGIQRHDQVQVEVRPSVRLRALSPAMPGETATYRLEAPAWPDATYVVAASFSIQNGFALGETLQIALDQDALFALSFPSPLPALFSGFQGSLDEEGLAEGIQLHLPPLPALYGRMLYLQAIVIDETFQAEVSDVLPVPVGV